MSSTNAGSKCICSEDNKFTAYYKCINMISNTQRCDKTIETNEQKTPCPIHSINVKQTICKRCTENPNITYGGKELINK